MKKYLVITKGRKNHLDYIGIPIELDRRSTKDELIKQLIFYIQNPNEMLKQLNKLETNVPYAVLSNGEFVDVSNSMKKRGKER